MTEQHFAGPEHRLERLLFFSDAVFAIAITLLVIELHAPALRVGANDRDYLHALVATGPAVMGFAVSFFVVGAFWAGHHRAFALARTWHDRLMLPNLLLLFTVAAMPFVTAFMSANLTGRVPVLIYVGWLLVIALANLNVQRLAFSPPVVASDVDPARVALARRRGQAVVLGALLTLAAALVLREPSQALLCLTTMTLWRRALTRVLDRPRPGQAAP